jgi:FixJ family two-component response regulator
MEAMDPQTQRTVLVVKDDSVLYQAIELALGRRGWRCEWYAYAPSNMDEVRGLGADGALIDVNLPAGNGIDLVVQMQAEGINIPIIVMTGYIDAAEKVRAMGRANVQVLLKPFDLQKMREMLSQAMDAAA